MFLSRFPGKSCLLWTLIIISLSSETVVRVFGLWISLLWTRWRQLTANKAPRRTSMFRVCFAILFDNVFLSHFFSVLCMLLTYPHIIPASTDCVIDLSIQAFPTVHTTESFSRTRLVVSILSLILGVIKPLSASFLILMLFSVFIT